MIIYLLPIKTRKKDRTIYVIKSEKGHDEIIRIIHNHLKQNKYQLGMWNEEKIYKRGSGFNEQRKFIRYFIKGDTITFEVFITLFGILWISNKEYPINKGFLASRAKKQVKTTIHSLIEKL